MRLWSDTTSGTPRGEIVHLQTKESVHFATWAQAEAFIRRFAPGPQVKLRRSQPYRRPRMRNPTIRIVTPIGWIGGDRSQRNPGEPRTARHRQLRGGEG